MEYPNCLIYFLPLIHEHLNIKFQIEIVYFYDKNVDKYNDLYFKVLIGKNILWSSIRKLASKKNGIQNYKIKNYDCGCRKIW